MREIISELLRQRLKENKNLLLPIQIKKRALPSFGLKASIYGKHQLGNEYLDKFLLQ